MHIYISHLIVLLFIAFFLGIFFMCKLYPKKKMVFESIKNKAKRFVEHFFSLVPVYIFIGIFYFLFKTVNYENQMLPNLISVGISVVFIDFLIKERENSEKHKINDLLNNKLDRIKRNVKDILLKFIQFDNYSSDEINEDLLRNILQNEDMNQAVLNYKIITDNGSLENIVISKFDYLYFIGKDLRPLVNSLILNYGRYFSSNQLCQLIDLENILDQKLFMARASLIGNLEGDEYERYFNALIDSLYKLYDISKKLK